MTFLTETRLNMFNGRLFDWALSVVMVIVEVSYGMLETWFWMITR
jgi:hypothetical protein